LDTLIFVFQRCPWRWCCYENAAALKGGEAKDGGVSTTKI
jgi:hypothetical protein